MRKKRLSITFGTFGTVGVIFMSMTLIFTGVAQQKRSLTPADYGQWEGLTYGEFSPDGRWFAYGISRTNGQNEMRLRSLTDDRTITAAFASEPAFSDDNRWLAYAIGYSEKEQERLAKAKKPAQRKMGLLDLTTRQTTVVENVAAFSFSKGGRFLAMRRYPTKTDPPAPGGEASDAGGEKEPLGVDLVVRDLSSGAETSFGNISNFAWQDNGTMLALTISAEGRAGNGVQLYEPGTGRLHTLDSGAFVYTGLSWKKDDDDLSVLRS
jgi:hypothetical protein